jgi:hypothetical protein
MNRTYTRAGRLAGSIRRAKKIHPAALCYRRGGEAGKPLRHFREAR